MDLTTSAQEAPSDFGEMNLHDAHDHSFGKSSHAFRTISEVSEEIDVPQHVLRFWESKFGQIRPLKRGGGRRYYRPEDIELLKRIKNYLYKQGYTIKGVQRLLKEKRSEAVANFIPYASPAASLPGFPFEQVVAQPSAPMLSIASYLQAAAAAPSAMAMAYSSIGGQIADKAGEHHFGDAFEQSTVKIETDNTEAKDQIEKSLIAVTQIHEEIATSVQPIRIANPAAPTLDDMAQDMVEEATAILTKPSSELEFNFETPVASATAAQPAVEAFEEEDFSQDAGEEDVPVKRLDDTVEVLEAELKVELGAYEEIAFADVPAATAAPSLTPAKKQELLGLLAEMMALRDMLRVEIVA